MTALDISPHLVANTSAKQILENSSESEQEFYQAEKNPAVVDPNQPQQEITQKQVRNDRQKRDQSKEMVFLLLK